MLLLFYVPLSVPFGDTSPQGERQESNCMLLPPPSGGGAAPAAERGRIFAPTCDAFCDAFCATLNMEISVSVFICDVTIAFFRQYSYNFTIEKV